MTMTYGCKIMVSLTLCRFFRPPCRSYIGSWHGVVNSSNKTCIQGHARSSTLAPI